MNTEVGQLRKMQITGIVFCIVCIVTVCGVLWLLSSILQKDVLNNEYCFVGFVVVLILFVLAILALLFFPDGFLSLITRLADKKIEEHTGCQNVIAELGQNESTIRAVMSKVESPSKAACSDKGVARLLKYMRRIDETVVTPKDFFKKAEQKDFARKYLNDISVLISSPKTDEESALCLRLLYAFVYDCADNHLASKEDSKAKIENMRLLLSKLAMLSGGKVNISMLYILIFGIMRNAFKQEDYKSVVEAYDLTQGSYLPTAEIRSVLISYMYEMVGAARLYLKDKNAIPYLKLALTCNPQNLTASFRLADYYFYRYDYVKAYEYAGRSFALLPDKGFSEEELDNIDVALSTVLYMSAFALGKLDEAYLTVSKIDERLGDDACIKGNRAYLAFKCGKYDEAERCVNQAWELDPNKGSVLNVRGMLFLRKGMYSKAAKAFMDAIKYFKPSKDNSLERFFYGEICNNCAVALCKNSEQEKAREWFDKALAVCYPDVSVDEMDALPPISCPDMTK